MDKLEALLKEFRDSSHCTESACRCLTSRMYDALRTLLAERTTTEAEASKAGFSAGHAAGIWNDQTATPDDALAAYREQKGRVKP